MSRLAHVLRRLADWLDPPLRPYEPERAVMLEELAATHSIVTYTGERHEGLVFEEGDPVVYVRGGLYL